VQCLKAIVPLVHGNIGDLRHLLDQLEEFLNAAVGQEEEFVDALLVDNVEEKFGVTVHVEKLSECRFEVSVVYNNGIEQIHKVDLDKWRGFRLDQWLLKKCPEFLKDLARGASVKEGARRGGRAAAESYAENYYERDFRWKDEVNDLLEKGKSIRSACRIIAAKEGANPETIRKTVSRF